MSLGTVDTGIGFSSSRAFGVKANASTAPRRRIDELEIMRWTFCLLLILSVAVLAFDVTSMLDGSRAPLRPLPQKVTVVPRIVQADAHAADGRDAEAPTARKLFMGLRQPMRFSMRAPGVLAATGMIDAGATARLAAEFEARGRGIRTLTLDSPGGSLDDAIAMARLVRAHRVATRVEDGAVCASSCPLLFAGGVTRSVGAGASVGVHQFYARGDAGEDPAQAMSDAQLATARIARHLETMGVDPLIWLKALATPPDALYALTRGEMVGYGLVTTPSRALKDAASPS